MISIARKHVSSRFEKHNLKKLPDTVDIQGRLPWIYYIFTAENGTPQKWPKTAFFTEIFQFKIHFTGVKCSEGSEKFFLTYQYDQVTPKKFWYRLDQNFWKSMGGRTLPPIFAKIGDGVPRLNGSWARSVAACDFFFFFLRRFLYKKPKFLRFSTF